MDDSLTITKTGSIISFTGTSANVAIPVDQSSQVPKHVRLAATQPCYVKVGTTSGITAAVGDILVQPADSIILRTIGLTHIAAVQVGTAGVLQISPLDNC